MKTLYTIQELADMAGVSWKRMDRLVRAYGIEFMASGRHTKLVPLSEIREKMKPLYDSCQMRERYQRIIATID
jgi:fibrillarin-like rRNA methylase